MSIPRPLRYLKNATVSCWLAPWWPTSLPLSLPQAATLSFEQQNAAEVLVPQLLLKDLLSHGSGDLHEAAMFVKECLEVRCYHD